MTQMLSVSFEERSKGFLSKEPALLLAELFPRLSHPSCSRFSDFFKSESKNQKINERKSKKNKK